jgi:hypothetical protein
MPKPENRASTEKLHTFPDGDLPKSSVTLKSIGLIPGRIQDKENRNQKRIDLTRLQNFIFLGKDPIRVIP